MRIEADGETWEAQLDPHEAHAGLRAIVFSCISNPQRPYHVVEVAAGELTGADRLDDLPRERLSQLFLDSDPLDVAHDPSAYTRHPVGHPLPPPPPGYEEIDRG